MAVHLGSAFVDLRADASLLRASALAGMRKALTGIEGDIPITAATKRASTQIRALLAYIASSDPTINVKVNANAAQQVLRGLRDRVLILADELDSMRANPDLSRDALHGIARMQLAAKKTAQELIRMKISPVSIQRAEASVLGLESGVGRLRSGFERVADATKEANARASFFASMAPRISALAAKLGGLTVDVKDRAFLAKIARIQARLAALSGRKIEISGAGFAKATADLAALEAAAEAMEGTLGNLNDRLTHGRVAWFGWIGGLLNARVALFAGARQVKGWHIALDGIVETLAILVPALTVLTAGLAAFGAAAFLAQDTAQRIGDRLKYINTIADATGKKIPPLTNHFDRMAKVIRPQVFELFGLAIGGAGGQLGLFDKLAVGTGAILDRFAARLVVDMGAGGAGVRGFVKTGTEDLKQLGVIFVNIGHVIAQLGRIAAETGIAEFLIKALAVASQALRLFLDLPTPLLAVVIGLHGVYLWSGLAATALVKLILGPIRGLAALAGGVDLARGAVRNLDKEAGGAKRIGAYFKDIKSGIVGVPGRIKILGGALKTLFSSPWTWAIIGAAIIIGLGTAFLTAKDQTDKFIISIDKMVATASIFDVINVTAAALTTTNQELADKQKQVNEEFKKTGGTAQTVWGRYGLLREQFGHTAQDAANLKKESSSLGDQLQTQSARVAEVAAKFGNGKDGLAGAMALVHLAGVKNEALFSKDATVYATALQQIQGLVTGYKNMGQGADQLGSDLNALTVAGSDQVKAIDQLNTAFDTFIKIVGAPVSGFITFAMGLQRFGEDAQKAGAHMTGFGGALIVTSKKVRSTSLQLQSDFQDTFNQAEQLFDSMRASEAPAAQQVKAIKLVTQVMIPMAGTSKVAAAEIFALAQEAGFHAAPTLQNLAKWAGKTKDPIGELQGVSDKAAEGFANLSIDAQRLGTALAQDLTQDMAKAVENAVGLQGAMNQFAIDMQKSGTSISKTKADRDTLRNDLIQVTGSAQQADAIIAAITGKIVAHGNAAVKQHANRLSFTDDVQAILNRAPSAGRDIDNLAKMIKLHGANSDAARGARQRLIDDLVHSGVSAHDAHGMVDGLRGTIDKLHGKTVNVGVHASGSGGMSFTQKVAGSISAGGFSLLQLKALGGMINGGVPGKDSVPIMAMPGEVVIPTSMVKAGSVDHLRGKLPGFDRGGRVLPRFAQGGVVGGSISSMPPWTADRETNFAVSMEGAFLRAGFAALKKAVAADAKKKADAARAAAMSAFNVSGAGPVGGDSGANKALARKMFPWGPGEWPFFDTLEMHEAGYNRFARNPSSGAYGIPQALPPTKMPFAAQAAGGSHAGPQLSWMYSYIRSVYGTPSHAWAQYYAHPGGVGYYGLGGMVGMATGGRTTAQMGQTYLNAWRSRRGGGFGAAWGPIVVNEQIARMQAAYNRANVLAHAKGLSSGKHRFWANAATDEKKRLAVLHKELTVERNWRGQLVATDLGLDRQIKAAGNLPSLRGNVKQWKAQEKAHMYTIGQISKMLGYSDAYIKAHPPAPKLPPIKHVYGGDVGDTIAPFLAAIMSPFGAAKGGMVPGVSMDQGGWLQPGWNPPMHNGTGRPERVGGDGNVTVTLVVDTGGGQADQFLASMIKKYVKVHGGNVQTAYGAH